MKKNYHTLPILFIAISSFTSVLAFYLLITKASFHTQVFLQACGEVIRNVKEYVHFSPSGALSTVIIITTTVGLLLALIQILKFIISYNKLLRKQKKNYQLPKKLLNIVQKPQFQGIPVVIIEDNPTAYTIGLIKPKIVLSKSFLQKASPQQLEAVLLHELFHINNNHLLWLLISRLISSLFFFIPLIEYIAQQLKIEFELNADSFVVKTQKTKEHLCSSLALNLRYYNGVVPYFATSPIEKRVESLVNNKFTTERVGFTRMTLSLFSLSLMLSLAFVQPTQIAAGVSLEAGGVCKAEEGCKVTDCSGLEYAGGLNFTPHRASSTPFSSSR